MPLNSFSKFKYSFTTISFNLTKYNKNPSIAYISRDSLGYFNLILNICYISPAQAQN